MKLVQDPGGIFGTLTNTPYGFSRKVHGPLRLSDKQEGEIVAIVEYSEAGADNGLAIRRPCKAYARLKASVMGIDLLPQTLLEVPAQAVIEREIMTQPPLILSVKAVVLVRERFGKILGFRWQVGILPVGGNRRGRRQLAVNVGLGGADRCAPEDDGSAVQGIVFDLDRYGGEEIGWSCQRGTDRRPALMRSAQAE